MNVKLSSVLVLFLALAGTSGAQTCVDLINLTFSPNSGNMAAHPNISNVTPWTNGSETFPDPFGSGLFTMPTDDFGNGYAGLTVEVPRFGFMWGFEGSFDLNSTQAWDVCSISFDYFVLGHNGEADLALSVGSWSGNTPLPSTGPEWLSSNPVFAPVAVGESSSGTVTFNFAGDTLNVTRTGYNPASGQTTVYDDYASSYIADLSLTSGTHLIDILTSNTATQSGGGWDANADSVFNSPNGLYRIDNFRITASQVPEPSASFLAISALGALLLRRRR